MKTHQSKICLLGDFAVGKTSLIRRYVEGRFDDKYLTTVGVVVSRKRLTVEDVQVNLLIWDLAGGRDFGNSDYLTGLSAAILVCDLTRSSTLSGYRHYASQVRQINPDAVLMLLANKSDLLDQRSISDEELQATAAELSPYVVLTSAKTGERVDEAFTTLAERLVKHQG